MADECLRWVAGVLCNLLRQLLPLGNCGSPVIGRANRFDSVRFKTMERIPIRWRMRLKYDSMRSVCANRLRDAGSLPVWLPVWLPAGSRPVAMS